MTRFIFVTGGVLSSLGKGLAMASLGALLRAHGYKVRLRKFEPYLNVDPGTMSPNQHGEVYVTEDGAETDLDLGHYERFTGVTCHASDAVTTGMIYSQVLAKERRGDFLGATVMVIPHITDAIKQSITTDIDDDTDFVMIEVGGTVGDIEGLPFLEAIRQFINEVGHERALFIHLTLLPYIPSAGELKTKPSQHSVKELLHAGIQPDFLVCRSDRPIPLDAKQKLALFCNVKPERVIEAIDVKTIYQVPLTFSEQDFDLQVLRYFGLEPHPSFNLAAWQSIVQAIQSPESEVTIAVVAKYTGLKDAYKSVIEALAHGGVANRAQVNIRWINAEDLEMGSETESQPRPPQEVQSFFENVDGILVPGGYGLRGAMGKLAAIRYGRENHIPYLGICFGMQLAVIETARNCAGLSQANSTEFGATPEPLVGLLTEWVREGIVERRDERSDLGGTMRLGRYTCQITPNSLAHQVYGTTTIQERHRHRYEINVSYREQLEAAGLQLTGLSPDGKLPEICERPDHPWFLGVQFHPELKSRPFEPHPLFKAFIQAAMRRQQQSSTETAK